MKYKSFNNETYREQKKKYKDIIHTICEQSYSCEMFFNCSEWNSILDYIAEEEAPEKDMEQVEKEADRLTLRSTIYHHIKRSWINQIFSHAHAYTRTQVMYG